MTSLKDDLFLNEPPRKKRRLDQKQVEQVKQVEQKHIPDDLLGGPILEYLGTPCQQVTNQGEKCVRNFRYMIQDPQEETELKASGKPILLDCSRYCIDVNSEDWFWNLLKNVPHFASMDIGFSGNENENQIINARIRSLESPILQFIFYEPVSKNESEMKISIAHPDSIIEEEFDPNEPIRLSIEFQGSVKTAYPSFAFKWLSIFMKHFSFTLHIFLQIKLQDILNIIIADDSIPKIGLDAITELNINGFLDFEQEDMFYFGGISRWQLTKTGDSDAIVVINSISVSAPTQHDLDFKTAIQKANEFKNVATDRDEKFVYGDLNSDDFYDQSEIDNLFEKASFLKEQETITPSP